MGLCLLTKFPNRELSGSHSIEKLICLISKYLDGLSQSQGFSYLSMGLCLELPFGEHVVRYPNGSQLLPYPPHALYNRGRRQPSMGFDIHNGVEGAESQCKVRNDWLTIGSGHLKRLAAVGIDRRVQLETQCSISFEAAFTGNAVASVLR